MMNFEVGDLVIVRDYEDIKSEFGNPILQPYTNGDIWIDPDCCWFDTEMQRYCGKQYKIKNIKYEKNHFTIFSYYSFEEDTEGYVFTPHMLTKVNNRERNYEVIGQLDDLLK